ncbi:hypothetical protein Hanom_Chr04g00367081 [Helianthus anomalus]
MIEAYPGCTRNRFHQDPYPVPLYPKPVTPVLNILTCTRVVPGTGSTENPVPLTCIHTRFRVGTGSGFYEYPIMPISSSLEQARLNSWAFIN